MRTADWTGHTMTIVDRNGTAIAQLVDDRVASFEPSEGGRAFEHVCREQGWAIASGIYRLGDPGFRAAVALCATFASGWAVLAPA